jgi:hypothetical protein
MLQQHPRYHFPPSGCVCPPAPSAQGSFILSLVCLEKRSSFLKDHVHQSPPDGGTETLRMS